MVKVERKKEESTNKNSKDPQMNQDSSNSVVTDEIDILKQELIETERKALGLFELTNDAIFLIDLDGNYIDVNQRAAEMLGYNRHDMIGQSKINFIVEEEHESAKEKLEDLLAGRIIPIYTRRFKRSDGTVFPTEINAAVVQDEEGEPAYIQSAVRDISERLEAEEALERERRAYHLIAEATIFATDITDLGQRIISGLTHILGFDASTFRLYDSNTGLLIPVAQEDFIQAVPNPDVIPQPLESPDHIFALAAREKRALVSTKFEDRKLLAPFQEKMKKLGIHDFITWPLLDGNNRLLGVLQFISYKPKEIPEEDMIFFQTIARMFTVALERKRAEEKLKESEEKYRSFAQNFQGIAYRTKIDWTPVFFHGAVKEITGYTEDELLFWNPRWEKIVHPNDTEYVSKMENELRIIPGNVIELEYRIIRKDGQIRWIHEISQNICDENRISIYIQGAINDISERKRTENMQIIQQDLGISLSSITNLKEALDSVLKATCRIDVIECGSIHLVDKDTGILNPISTKELSKEFVDKISYYSTESPFTKAILTGQPIYSDFNDLTRDIDEKIVKNEKLHALANIPIYSEDKIVAMLTLGSRTSDTIPINTRKTLEITSSIIGGAIARIRAEFALRESDEKYRTFVQNFQGIAYRLNHLNELLFFAGAVEEITGYTSEELVDGKSSRDEIIHPYDLEELNQKLKESIDAPSNIGKHEYRIITKDGQIRWVQDIWQPLKDEMGAVDGFLGSMHNITDRKLAQNEIQKLYQDLERRVEDRTEQLTATNKELTAFSYSVSHDLRTPIRHIGGFATLLEKRISSIEGVDEKIISYTQKINDSVEEMNKLIDGLLTFSRMSRVEMVRIRINFTELIQDVLNDYQVELGNRKIDVTVSFLPDVLGDPSLLRLVLVNLVANALKFTKKKDIAQIEIGTMPSKDPDKITVFISDNGVGFDMKYYDRLFGVFQRLHKNEDFDGTGIGLATVQRVVRRMGGTIWAESEIDKGATFYFSIIKASEDDEDQQIKD
ncbi:MAG: PAS domain S-box protein [Candidatus Heimdallarchaeota archaeon]|nr:MAG: PAS domain S-box protein [Candidatus Heimdallarchaeota archaeon]